MPRRWSPRSTGRVLVRAGRAFASDHVLRHAAALAFYTLLSFAPLIVLGVWLAASVAPAAQASLLDQIEGLAGPALRDAGDAVLASANRPSPGSWAGVFGIAVSVFGATTVFAQLQASLNAILGVEAVPSAALWAWLRRRLLSLGVVAAIAFVLIVSLVFSALLAMALPGRGAVWDTANQVVSVAVLAFLFGLLFRYLPDARIPWPVAFGGGTTTAIAFTFGKWAIGIYLARASVAGAYGAAGSLAILLLWVYYSAALFLSGAELIKAYLDECRVRVRPTAFGRLRTGPEP